MVNESEVSLVVCSPPFVCATALLNPNAFPEAAKLEVDAAARRLAVVFRNGAALRGEIDRAAQEFAAHLKRNWAGYASAIQRRPDLHCIAYPDGLHYLSSLHSVLYEFKAFLDLYARLLCKLIAARGAPPGFNRKKIDGVELSGGRVASWINLQPIEHVPNKSELYDRIVTASREWITPAVNIRDTLGHYRDPPGFRHMRIQLTNGPEAITLSDISRPGMPDGKGLDEYASELCERLGKFVSETIRLAPTVKEPLLEPWDRAIRYLHE